MKKSIISAALLLTSASAFAETEYPQNPVLRPLTLTDGTVFVGAALARAEEKDVKRTVLGLHVGYGLTDNVTLGLDGIKYRFLARDNNSTGLELTVGAGLRGFQESSKYGDSVAYGADLNGKYVFNKNFATIFSAGYVEWDEDKRKNKGEFRYSIGLQANIVKDWTASASYTYRDLIDFEQDEAYKVNVGINYAYSKSTDIGLFAGYSNFDAQKESYKFDNNFDRVAGVYAAYRF